MFNVNFWLMNSEFEDGQELERIKCSTLPIVGEEIFFEASYLYKVTAITGRTMSFSLDIEEYIEVYEVICELIDNDCDEPINKLMGI